MFTTIREYRMSTGSVDDLMHIVDGGLADIFAEQEGFLGYEVLAAEGGRILSITTFRDEDGARSSDALAAEFVREELGEFGIQRLGSTSGEVMVSRAGSEMLAPVHH